jgi:transposase
VANRIKMATASAIVELWRQGWSYRRIARELDVHRETVARYVKLAREEPKPANPTPGAGGQQPSKPSNPTAGSSGPKSRCEPFREIIIEKLEAGLTAQRIWQDLRYEHGFGASYSSVKRFVRRLRTASPLPFRRMEQGPGEEAQVDFGRGAPIVTGQGRRRYPHLFRIVLSFSRKAYSEVVYRQTTESFIRCLENAFRAFGGVPRTLVIDNLRAAVKKADWFEPELNPKVESFCGHYGTVILPTRPRMPRHKGKVERGVGYAKDNALKGRTFASLQEQNLYLKSWEERVADHRIHGTTRKQVKKVFEDQEKSALRPLPAAAFPFFHEGRRSVHRDAHVEVDKAYYSVPPEYLRRKVWVRWDSRLVRIFNHRMEEVAVHTKKERGQFSTDRAHLASEKISGVEQGAEALLKRARRIGPHAGRWAQKMLKRRGIRGVRVLLGLLSLAGKHSRATIEKACELAQSHQGFRLKDVRARIRAPSRQKRLQFMDSHPLIRDIRDYGKVAGVSFRQENDGFIASGDTGGSGRGEEPGNRPGPPAVYPPDAALGSLPSVALSSGPAQKKVSDSDREVNSQKGGES